LKIQGNPHRREQDFIFLLAAAGIFYHLKNFW